MKAWYDGNLKPQQLSAALPGFAETYQAKTPEISPNDLEFEQYLKKKEFAEQGALAQNIAEGLDEIPMQLSRENFLHVFDNEPDPLWSDNT